MAPGARPSQAKKPQRHSGKASQPPTNKRKRDHVDAEELATGVAQLDTTPTASYTSFADLPLSAPTVAGLKAAHFTALTDIQAQAIPLALQGADILGAARTGSGKTLAFIIPVLENLYRAQCVGADAGLGAMIVSPTRELAIQIFEVLRKIGRKGHLFAAGLVIGGKSLRDERDALARMNIVVGTPGRLLQHLSQTAAFQVDNLQMLVLDEADRILDMGFQRDVDAIVEYLPPSRQTLLFSATQTKRVSDLARLSLRDPKYVSVHEASTTATPSTLQQNYTLTPLPDKLDTLWSFLQSSKKAKILVFLSSGKQVRFVYEAFRHMQPGIPLLHLHGRQKQTARLDITDRFSRAQHSCLFATDVVARGLDFPAVDWVVQLDCPEDADTYIHRVGRTARYERAGRAVLFLDPSEEEGFLRRLEQKRVPIERINVRPKKQHSIRDQIQSMCFQDPQLKYLGQKAFVSYVRSLYVQKDKEVFRLAEYKLEEFAASLGLPGAPRIKFLKADADAVKRRKNAPRGELEGEDSSDDGEDDGEEVQVGKKKEDTAAAAAGVRTKYDRMFERKNQDVLAEHYAKMIRADDDDDEKDNVDLGKLDGAQADDADDDLFDIKRRIPAAAPTSDSDTPAPEDPATAGTDLLPKTILLPGARAPLTLDSNRRAKLLTSKKKLLRFKDKGSKTVFDDEGNPHAIYELEDEGDFRARGAAEEQRAAFVRAEGERVKKADEGDKAMQKAKRREKRERRREREREVEDEGAMVAGAGEVEEDGLANFLADAAAASHHSSEEDGGDGGGEVGEERPRKKVKALKAKEREAEREKKWFENDKAMERSEKESRSQNERRRGNGRGSGRDIETMDDLEAEAARVLGA